MLSKSIRFINVLDRDCLEPANRAAMVKALRELGYRVNVLHRPIPIEMVRDDVAIKVFLIDETLPAVDAGAGLWRLLDDEDRSGPSDMLFGDLRFAINTREGVGYSDIRMAAEEIPAVTYHVVTMVPKLLKRYEQAAAN